MPKEIALLFLGVGWVGVRSWARWGLGRGGWLGGKTCV